MFIHQENMSVKCIPPQTLLLDGENGDYRGKHFFQFGWYIFGHTVGNFVLWRRVSVSGRMTLGCRRYIA